MATVKFGGIGYKNPGALLLAAGDAAKPRRRVIHSDVMDFVQDYDGPKFHALFCDPPYHLTSITNRFGKTGSAPAQYGKDGAFSRVSRGFMDQQWDGGDIAFRAETWAAFKTLMYPGAFGMAFASTRGYHRMVCAIEDAGFVIHPMIAWVFGSGFPKATRVPDERFDGHRYGLQAIKPSPEPVCVFQKPYEGRPIDCITSTGAGAIFVDGGRIVAYDPAQRLGQGRKGGDGIYNETALYDYAMSPLGRWPANFALAHDIDCDGSACTPACAVRRFGEQSGERAAGSAVKGTEPSSTGKNVYYHYDRVPYVPIEDTGTAARFFHNSDWAYEVAEQIYNADPAHYVAKASASERSEGLTQREAVTVNDGRQTPIDNAYQRGETLRLNTHPTVKPISLTEWLATLLLPPAALGPRRLLVPFAGSGSEMIGAMKAGWETIYGIEQSYEYASIARERIAHHETVQAKVRDPFGDRTASPATVPSYDALPLFAGATR